MNHSEDANKFFLEEQNKKKKKELEEKFGAEFHKEDSQLEPEIENLFLNNVMKFEEEWENAKEVEIYEYLGKPKLKKLKDIKEENLSIEIENVLELYNRNNINISVIEKDDLSDEEFYKFLSEELLHEKFYPMPLSGMTSNFIYEEFHPSNKLDAKTAIEDVLLSAINRNREFAGTYIADESLLRFNNKQITEQEFIDNLFLLFEDVEEEIDRKFEYKKFQFENENIVDAELVLSYKQKSTSAEIEKIFSFNFELVPSEYGGLVIKSYKLLEK